MAGAVEGDLFIGRRAQELRGLLKIKYPVEHGIVTDWEDMERIWAWAYSEELRTLSEEVRERDTSARRRWIIFANERSRLNSGGPRSIRFCSQRRH